MSSTTASIGRLHLVTVTATDQEAAAAFYETLGLERRVDIDFEGGHRWIELFPPDGIAGVAIAPGDATTVGAVTGIILTTEDIDATHAAYRAAGLDVDAEIARAGSPASIRIGALDVVEPFPPMFHVRDPDGNAVMVVEPG
jgi:catechol 2,3-dioxygenase-like lactoylglutathione lyase family enzyme